MLNTAILKSPSNWFLVAFSVVILALVSHLLIKGNNNG
jgi:hypothetical protein